MKFDYRITHTGRIEATDEPSARWILCDRYNVGSESIALSEVPGFEFPHADELGPWDLAQALRDAEEIEADDELIDALRSAENGGHERYVHENHVLDACMAHIDSELSHCDYDVRQYISEDGIADEMRDNACTYEIDGQTYYGLEF